MLDIKNYIEKKEKKLIAITKVGSGFVLSAKRFDTETGQEVAPVAAGFHVKDIEKIKTELEQAIANADVLIADINKI